jgi:hypothetical protein
MRPWVESLTLSTWELTQSHIGFTNAKVIIHKEWCWLLKVGCLAGPTRMGGSS